MKKMKALAQVKLLGTKICINGHKLETNSFDLEFWSKIKFGTLFNPFVFFSHPILSFIPYFMGVVIPSFNNFTITLLSSKQNVILLGYVLVGLKVFPMANIVTWLVNQILNEVNVTMV
jgi:hypothetical protein